MWQKAAKNVLWHGECSCLQQESSVFMRKKNSDNQHSIKDTKDLTMKQMFDISSKLLTEQDEILWANTSKWDDLSWKHLSLVVKKSSVSCTEVYVFTDSLLSLGKIHENTQLNTAWEQRLGWFQKYTGVQNLGQNWWWANGIQVDYFPRIQHIAAQPRSSRVTVEIQWNTREFSRKDHLHTDVHDISCGSKLRLQRDRCDPLSLKEVKILKGRSTCWRILILVPQMSNPRVKKLYSMSSRTMKLWSRWSLQAEVRQWEMFPEPTELLLIGCLIESILDPKIEITSTPKTNSQKYWPKEISHVMSEIIGCACSISVISVLQCALTHGRNDLKKIQEKNESQQNRDQWWILLPGRRRSCRHQLQWARGRNITEI